jgi:hypothetical protein
MDDEAKALAELWGRERKAEPSAAARRRREMRPVSTQDRRTLRSVETKTVQLNLKITPSLKAKISSLALSGKISMAELLERAIAAYGDGE